MELGDIKSGLLTVLGAIGMFIGIVFLFIGGVVIFIILLPIVIGLIFVYLAVKFGTDEEDAWQKCFDGEEVDTTLLSCNTGDDED